MTYFLTCGRPHNGQFGEELLQVGPRKGPMERLGHRPGSGAERPAGSVSLVRNIQNSIEGIGVRVTRSVRRIVLHLPRAHPDPNAWRAIATSFGAVHA